MGRLVLFEGLPGSGKSTLSQDLYLHLCRADDSVLWIAEDQRPHPLIMDTELGAIDESNALAAYAKKRWQRIAADARRSESTLVLDAALFGMTLGGLLRHDSSSQLLTETLREIEAVLAPLRPVLIYLRPEHSEGLLNQVSDIRGPEWVEYMVDELSPSAFARTRKVGGRELVIAYFRELNQVFDSAYGQLSLERHTINVVHGDLEKVRKEAMAIMESDGKPPALPSSQWLTSLSGTYRSTDDDTILTLLSDGDELVIGQEHGARLIHADNNAFMVRGMPVDVTFDVGTDGVTRARFCDRTAGSDDVPSEWVKV